MQKPYVMILSAFILAFGMAAGLSTLGAAVGEFTRGPSTVTVKGLVERDVKADRVQWNLNSAASGNELAATYAKARADQASIKKFLTDGGIAEADMGVTMSVVDQQANQYRDAAQTGPRFIISSTVSVNTAAVEKVAALTQKTGDLIAAGVVLVDGGFLNYRFEGLNTLKPEMLQEATKNARTAAAQFAADSDSTVGEIKRANQGVFTINARGQDFDNGTVIDKTVRVVTTVEYFLD